jgi:hypothetical protein
MLLAGTPVLLRVLTTPGTSGADETANHVESPTRVAIKNGVAVLTVDAADQRSAGIVTARPSPAPRQSTTIGFGSIIDAAGLTELDNRYRDAASGVTTAEAKLAAAQAAYRRAVALHRDQQNVSTAELQEAEAAFKVATAALAAAQSRLTSVAASARQDWGSVLGAALITRAPLLSELVDRRSYLVNVTLPTGEAITPPPAMITARIVGDRRIRLDFISPATSLDPRLQALRYLYKTAAASGVLPGLRFDLPLRRDTARREVVIPDAAVVWLEGKPWIYTRTGPTTFERRAISARGSAADGGYLVTDLAADARIVVRGAQMLLSEEFRAEAPIED